MYVLSSTCTSNLVSVTITFFLQAIMESEPFKLTLKDKNDALKLGKDFAKELGT